MDGINDSMDMSLSILREIVKDGRPSVLQSMGSQRVRHNLATEQQQKRESITGMWKNMDKALTGVSMGS